MGKKKPHFSQKTGEMGHPAMKWEIGAENPHFSQQRREIGHPLGGRMRPPLRDSRRGETA